MKALSSKPAAWAAILLIAIVIAITFKLRTQWWCFIDIFFAFMMAFCHLTSLYLKRISVQASRQLEATAAVFGALFVAALIGEFVAWQILF